VPGPLRGPTLGQAGEGWADSARSPKGTHILPKQSSNIIEEKKRGRREEGQRNRTKKKRKRDGGEAQEPGRSAACIEGTALGGESRQRRCLL